MCASNHNVGSSPWTSLALRPRGDVEVVDSDETLSYGRSEYPGECLEYGRLTGSIRPST